MNRTKTARFALICSALMVLGGVPAANAGMIITPFFDSTVTPSQQTVINNAISFYQTSFSDNITVNIEFITQGSGGSSLTSLYAFGYNTVKTMLQNDATAHPANTVLLSALTNLPAGNTAQQFEMTSANCRALASTCAGTVSGTGSVVSSTLDSIITIGSGNYGNTAVAQHEIDEVLGIGGTGTILGSSQTVNGLSTIRMLDPYRYSASGTASLTTSAVATSYLSLNSGATSLAGFNQSGIGDYGDFTTSTCYVQSFSTCANPLAISLTSPEGLALQAIGYDAVSSVPEPAALSMMTLGLMGLGVAVRRSRNRFGNRG